MTIIQVTLPKPYHVVGLAEAAVKTGISLSTLRRRAAAGRIETFDGKTTAKNGHCHAARCVRLRKTADEIKADERRLKDDIAAAKKEFEYYVDQATRYLFIHCWEIVFIEAPRTAEQELIEPFVPRGTNRVWLKVHNDIFFKTDEEQWYEIHLALRRAASMELQSRLEEIGATEKDAGILGCLDELVASDARAFLRALPAPHKSTLPN